MLFESMLAIGAVLLIGSGGAKLIDRAPTRGALNAANLPATEAVVVGLAVSEVAIGSAALTVDHPVASMTLAVTYLAFAAFVGLALHRGIPIQSCGCFGKNDTPPTSIHIAVNLSIAAAALAGSNTPPLLDRVLEEPPLGLGFAAMAVIGAYLTYLLLAELPATLQAVKGPV